MAHGELRRLLGLCSTGHADPEHDRLRAEALAAVPDLGDLLRWAEEDGIAPLVALHLGTSSALPPEIRRGLLGLAARHSLAHRVRAEVLGDAIAELNAAGIEHLFLKGAALAHSAYPRPELRAMRDVDLLLRERDVAAAERALERAGFVERTEARPGRHELVTRTRRSGGFGVGIDLHRRLGLLELPSYAPALRQTFDDLAPSSQPLAIGGAATRALGREDLLRSVFRHGFCLQLDEDRMRLRAVADAVTAMETWVDALDWERLRALDPAVVRGLAMLHHVVPLSPRVLRALGYRPARAPRGVADQYWGWPRVDRPRRGDYAPWLLATLFPSEWWLRTRHGKGAGTVGLLLGWSQHVDEVLRTASRALTGAPRPDR